MGSGLSLVTRRSSHRPPGGLAGRIVFGGLIIIAIASAISRAKADVLIFGNTPSEREHALQAERSETITGALGEPARRLLAPPREDWQGGHLSFTMKVDPEKQNYATIRLWGSDLSADRLVLYIEGKQIGYRHLGDIDQLDFGSDEPAYNGRFFYNTTPLPLEMTRGKTELHCEIRSGGRVWGYGSSFAQYQKPMTEPTRGLYRLYTHTDGFFTPPAEEKQGDAPVQPSVRRSPGPEVLDAVKKRVNSELEKCITSAKPLSQQQLHLLAKAWHVKWTSAYHDTQALQQIVKAVDQLYFTFRNEPMKVRADPAMYNSDWFATGPAADAVRLLSNPLEPFLDKQIEKSSPLTRREAWSALFQDGRDWLRQHRRLYTNQSMITDMNIYRSNRGVAAIDPAHALPEPTALRYLYEAIGLEPWLGSEANNGPTRPLGDSYFQLTARGLTKELGYVGYYGEVIDWVTQIYDATRDPGQPGDPKIKTQLEKIAQARAAFRYPALDPDGYRAMRIETIIGWRDAHNPGDIVYGERPTWDASPLFEAAATLSAPSIGYAQQMIADHQLFAAVERSMKERSLRATAGLLGFPEQLALIEAQPPMQNRLPMTPGQPDFVFTDEEDGVVALKNGEEILYVSLYWRARFAVNFLARIHFITPRFDRIAVVREEVRFEPSGAVYKRPDWTNFGFGNGGPKYPSTEHSAHAGEELPIAKVPDGVSFKPGDESVYAGKGNFYALQYGPYFIAMNLSKTKTQHVTLPTGLKSAFDLVSRKTLTPSADGAVELSPLSTLVVHLDSPASAP